MNEWMNPHTMSCTIWLQIGIQFFIQHPFINTFQQKKSTYWTYLAANRTQNRMQNRMCSRPILSKIWQFLIWIWIWTQKKDDLFNFFKVVFFTQWSGARKCFFDTRVTQGPVGKTHFFFENVKKNYEHVFLVKLSFFIYNYHFSAILKNFFFSCWFFYAGITKLLIAGRPKSSST